MRASFLIFSALAAATAGVAGIGDWSNGPALGETSVLPENGASVAAPIAKTERAGSAEAFPIQLTAQAAPERAPAATPASPPAGAKPAVDESALRYFAIQGDTVRLQAEIARLRALYPGWEPPKDPLAIATGSDPRIEELWKLYAQSRYDEVDKAIAERQRTEPGWTPPQELVDSLRLARTRQAIVKASDDGQYQAVIDLAAKAPQLLTCNEVDMLWRVGEAFARTERPGRAKDSYSYILKNCSNPQERLATVQKASQLLDPASIEALLKLEQPGPGGKPEFDPIRTDIARALIAKGGEDGKLVVSEADLDRLETAARQEDNGADSLLLGWYFYRRSEMPKAQEWFRRAFEQQPVAAAAQGLALTQVALDAPGEAEDVLYRFRDSSDETKAVYLAAVANLLALDPPKAIDNTVLSRMAPAVIAARNTAAAEQFGWYALMVQQVETAADWFRLVLSWDQAYEPAAYGLAVSLHTLGDEAGVTRLQREWSGRSERITTLRDAPGRVRTLQSAAGQSVEAPVTAVAEPPRRVIDETPPRPETVRSQPVEKVVRVSGCRSSIDAARLSPAAALSRGWCLMDIKRAMEAIDAFDRALAGGDIRLRQDAAYGKSLAYLRLKLTEKAAVAATAVPQKPARAAELQTAIITDRALDAFRQRRYNETIILLDQRRRLAPERQDLMMLRGAAYQQLGHVSAARRIYQALANTGNKAALRALGDMMTRVPG